MPLQRSLLGCSYGKENLVVNITDVPVPVIETKDTLVDLARKMMIRQTELEDEYFRIEKRPERFWYNLDDRVTQTAIKDSLWRITEEVGEALEAKRLVEQGEKIHEELADGLHFLIRLNINLLLPMAFEEAFDTPRRRLDSWEWHVVQFVEEAGKLGNTLKMKAWKQTDMATDRAAFEKNLKNLNLAYIYLCFSLGLDHHSIFQYYWRKSEVNLFRIRSKY